MSATRKSKVAYFYDSECTIDISYSSLCAHAQQVDAPAHLHVAQQAQRKLTGHPAARGVCGSTCTDIEL
jgi:hypothetical protein